MIPPLLKRIAGRCPEPMTEAEAFDLFAALLDGAVPEMELGALLTALALKPMDPEQLSGFYRAARGRINRLAPGSPGTIAAPPSRARVADARSSSRRSASRFFASAPWQRKHRSARIGRMSRS